MDLQGAQQIALYVIDEMITLTILSKGFLDFQLYKPRGKQPRKAKGPQTLLESVVKLQLPCFVGTMVLR